MTWTTTLTKNNDNHEIITTMTIKIQRPQRQTTTTNNAVDNKIKQTNKQKQMNKQQEQQQQ